MTKKRELENRSKFNTSKNQHSNDAASNDAKIQGRKGQNKRDDIQYVGIRDKRETGCQGLLPEDDEREEEEREIGIDSVTAPFLSLFGGENKQC